MAHELAGLWQLLWHGARNNNPTSPTYLEDATVRLLHGLEKTSNRPLASSIATQGFIEDLEHGDVMLVDQPALTQAVSKIQSNSSTRPLWQDSEQVSVAIKKMLQNTNRFDDENGPSPMLSVPLRAFTERHNGEVHDTVGDWLRYRDGQELHRLGFLSSNETANGHGPKLMEVVGLLVGALSYFYDGRAQRTPFDDLGRAKVTLVSSCGFAVRVLHLRFINDQAHIQHSPWYHAGDQTGNIVAAIFTKPVSGSSSGVDSLEILLPKLTI